GPGHEQIQWPAVKFPTQQNRELFQRKRQISFTNREFSRSNSKFIARQPISTGTVGRPGRGSRRWGRNLRQSRFIICHSANALPLNLAELHCKLALSILY